MPGTLSSSLNPTSAPWPRDERLAGSQTVCPDQRRRCIGIRGSRGRVSARRALRRARVPAARLALEQRVDSAERPCLRDRRRRELWPRQRAYDSARRVGGRHSRRLFLCSMDRDGPGGDADGRPHAAAHPRFGGLPVSLRGRTRRVLPAGRVSLGRGVDVAPFLPRIRSGRVVLSLAQWRLSGSGHPDAVVHRRDLFSSALQQWREEWRVPQHVYLTAGDNRLLLDLEVPDQADEIRRVLHVRPTASVLLTEVFPDFEHAWVRDTENRPFITELVVPLLSRVSRATVASTPTARVPAARTASVCRGVDRVNRRRVACGVGTSAGQRMAVRQALCLAYVGRRGGRGTSPRVDLPTLSRRMVFRPLQRSRMASACAISRRAATPAPGGAAAADAMGERADSRWLMPPLGTRHVRTGGRSLWRTGWHALRGGAVCRG